MDKIETFILDYIRRNGVYNDKDKNVMDLLDSFEYIELIIAIEQEFGVKLDLSKPADVITVDGKPANLLTVNGIMRQINSIMKG